MRAARLLQAFRLYLGDRQGWEAVCDRCGRCCFERTVDDEGSMEVHYDAPCELLDIETRLCRDYEHRLAACPRCHRVTPWHATSTRWLPPGCAYLRRFLG